MIPVVRHCLTPKFLSQLILCLTFSCACNFSIAEDELTEVDFFGDLPAVVSATRLPQSVMDTPVSVTVLDRDMIEASGFVEMGDLFRLVPGFQVGLSMRDHHTAVTYHGQTDGLSRRMQVLIDGRVAFSSSFGVTDWDRSGITVKDVERIEVVRGPAGSAYGSNSFVGAINVVTKDAITAPGTSFTVTSGGENTTLASARYSHSGKDSEYTLAASYLKSDGFKHGNSEVDVTSFRAQGRNQVTLNWMMDYQLGHAAGPSGRGGTMTLVDPVGNKDAKEQHAMVRLTNTAAVDNEWFMQFTYNRMRHSDKNYVGTVGNLLKSDLILDWATNDPYADANQFASLDVLDSWPEISEDDHVWVGPYDYHADRLLIDGQQTLTLNNQSRLVWGTGYQESRIKGQLTVGDADYCVDRMYMLYGNWEYQLGDFLFNLGTMFEDGDLANSDLSSRFGVNYHITPNQVVRFSAAKGWRHPFIGEAKHDLALQTEQNNPIERFLEVPESLESEKITSFELGYVGFFLDGALRTDAKLFKEKISNEIQEVVNPFAPQLLSLFPPYYVMYRVNGGATEIDGIEISADYRFDQGTRVSLAYAYADADQDLPVLAVRSFYANSGTPTHTASMLLSHRFDDGWSASMGYYYLDEMAWYLWGGDIDSYTRIDARIAKYFSVAKSQIKIELIGQNLGDTYSEFVMANEFDSKVFVRATVAF
jgi:iron complex outermembrane receptor protein